MKLQKKKLAPLCLAIIAIAGVFVCQPLQAIGLKDGFGSAGQLNNFAQNSGYSAPKDLEYYVGLILNVLFSIIGIVAVSLFFYSGFDLMTAKGNESQVEKAKANFKNAIIGIIIIATSYAITVFILKIFA